MTQIGKAVVGLMTVTFVVHATNPIHQAEAIWCSLEPPLQWRRAISDRREMQIPFIARRRRDQPTVNQCRRCADEPCVQWSGLIRPVDFWIRSSPPAPTASAMF